MSQMELRLRDSALKRQNTRFRPLVALLRHELLQVYRRTGEPVSADQARAYMELHPEIEWPQGNNWLGCLFRGWRCVGYRKSETRGRHGSVVRLWEPNG